jgi:hypothetical protein
MSERDPTKQERAEIERRIRAAIEHNQAVARKVPDSATPDEYWDTIHREGQPLTISVVDEGEQVGMYVLAEDEGLVELTYFRDDGTVGESFWIEIDRIIAVR